MNSTATNLSQYQALIPEDRAAAFQQIISVFQENLPAGYHLEFAYGMPTFVVPKSLYPAGYHCDTSVPLPLVSVANQKNFIAVYHMGLYAHPEIYDWFVEEYPKHCKTKLDMGKSCIRFKKILEIPYDLLAELAQKFTVEDWIQLYETNFRKEK